MSDQESVRVAQGVRASPPARAGLAAALIPGGDNQAVIARATRLSAELGIPWHAIVLDPRTTRGPLSRDTLFAALQSRVHAHGGSFHLVAEGHDPAATFLGAASDLGATQLLIEAHPFRRFRVRPTFMSAVVAGSAGLDVHVLPVQETTGTLFAHKVRLSAFRTISGFVLALLCPPIVQLSTSQRGEPHALELLVHIAAIVLVALVGGLWPALVCALFAALLINMFATLPYGSLHISEPHELAIFVVFALLALAVSLVISNAARQRKEASIMSRRARTLNSLATSLLNLDEPVEPTLARVREHFGAQGAQLFRIDGPAEAAAQPSDHSPASLPHAKAVSGQWTLLASAGAGSSLEAADVHTAAPNAELDTVEIMDAGLAVVVRGIRLGPEDVGMLRAFGAYLVALYNREELRRATRDNKHLQEGNSMRNAILQAVSHDLRTPLTAIKIASGTLAQPDVRFEPEDEAELLNTVSGSADRLEALIDNLLDMSRIAGRGVSTLSQPVSYQEVVAKVLSALPDGEIRVEIDDDFPLVFADSGMLERIVANVLENALKYGALPGLHSGISVRAEVKSEGAASPGWGRLLIIDHGSGVAPERLEEIFQPFQRLTDRSSTGVGLGLSVARGFARSMGGKIEAQETPGGGLSVVISIPLADIGAKRTEPEEGSGA